MIANRLMPKSVVALKISKRLYLATYTPKRRSSTNNSSLVTRHSFHSMAAKKRMMFNAFLPKIFAAIPIVEIELNSVFIKTLQANNSNLNCNYCILRLYL